MTTAQYDFIIIGGGAAAFAAATKASELGLRAAMINDGLPVGGTCVNVGCVPSKHLLAVGDHLYYPQHPTFDALTNGHTPSFDFRTAMDEKRRLVGALRESNYSDVFGSLKDVEYIEGRACFTSPTEVDVGGRLMWDRDLGGPRRSPLTTAAVQADGWLFVGREDGMMLALGPATTAGGPPALGNSLRAAKGGADVVFSWQPTFGLPDACSHRLRSGSDPAARPLANIVADVPPAPAVDPGGVTAGPPLVLYRVHSLTCCAVEV